MRTRVLPYLLVGAVLALTCSAGVRADGGGNTAAPPDDRGTASDEPGSEQPAERGPGWETLWEMSVPHEAGRPFDLLDGAGVHVGADGALLVSHSGVVDVFDLATGALRFSVDPPLQVHSMAQLGNVVLVHSADDPRGAVRRYSDIVTAYDASSGALLWQQRGGPEGTLQPGEDGALRDTTVVLTERGAAWVGPSYLSGQDPVTGEWTWGREDDQQDCVADGVAATRGHALLLRECPDGDTVVEAVDPASGSPAWRQELGPLEEPRLSVTPDLVAVNHVTGGRPTVVVLDEAGETVTQATIQDPEFLAEMGITLLGRDEQNVYLVNGATLYALNAKAGEISWQRSTRWRGWWEGLWRTEGGDVVSVGGNGNWYDTAALGRPAESVVTDPDGRQYDVPLPNRGDPVGHGGDVLVTATRGSDGTRLSALRLRPDLHPEPVGLGGVPAAEWPDACALLSDDALGILGAERGTDYERLPVDDSREVNGTTLPHVPACRFASASGSAEELFEVGVRWVARDAETARRIAGGGLPWGVWEGELRALGSDSLLYGVASGPAGGFESVIMARGREVIVVVGRERELVLRVGELLASATDG
ncbi:PQQ-binding-like beta-propeller repeat protein [Streptomyces sp. 3MP-14]|uniref:PQQ-binding-like beta-propeller repeat protein n=1 Tax=Streptomyces mimosae TaxID=2586635 RepID=A0A5N6AAP4_9ACTN|nr:MULTISPECIES: PQQ-binding-like beta-propeller repeat protein [Streptomyces]KAB8165711.1 PQQ-binding-like beta-propeller repeat protein [Streptomyces mimosae]KAB8176100.1 PQQ-binding-like beta-propeller repeat protein [Streptomyces sp. 3MP-14]